MKSKIDYKEITKLIDLLETRNLSHFELEVEGLKISIGRQSQSSQHLEISTVPTANLNNNSHTILTETDAASPETKDDLHYITSPMVGTFYRAPDPSSPSFIKVGEPVKKSQTLCLIEAMKLMNEIEADIEGVLAEIFVKNGNPVEYGQKLFAIKPEK